MVIIIVVHFYIGGDFIQRSPETIKQWVQTKLSFFSSTPFEKAQILSEKHLSFWAGLNYMDCHEYYSACEAFEKSKAYKHLIIACAKQGYYEKAIKLADEKKYYKLGSKVALHYNDLKQAAYFYSYFDPSHAAKLYRDLRYYYEAGFAFLAANDPLDAIDMFRRCNKQWQKEKGFQQVSEYALVLYLQKSYETAFKLFMALDDYYSALECARALDEDKLIEGCYLLIGHAEAEKKDFIFAAKCVEPYNTTLAAYYYALGGSYNEQVRILLEEGDYNKAHKVCLLHNNLNQAYEIASIYNPDLLTS